SPAGTGLRVPIFPADGAATRSLGFSRACLVLLRSPRALPETHNSLDTLLWVRLVVEGGDHRGARARPFGDVAVVGIGSKIEPHRNPGLAEGFWRRVSARQGQCEVRGSPEVP